MCYIKHSAYSDAPHCVLPSSSVFLETAHLEACESGIFALVCEFLLLTTGGPLGSRQARGDRYPFRVYLKAAVMAQTYSLNTQGAEVGGAGASLTSTMSLWPAWVILYPVSNNKQTEKSFILSSATASPAVLFICAMKFIKDFP